MVLMCPPCFETAPKRMASTCIRFLLLATELLVVFGSWGRRLPPSKLSALVLVFDVWQGLA